MNSKQEAQLIVQQMIADAEVINPLQEIEDGLAGTGEESTSRATHED